MNNPDQETKSEKPAPLIDLMSPKIFYPIWLWILLLIVFIIILFTGKNLNEISDDTTSDEAQNISANIFLILFFLFIGFVICLALIPNFKELKQLFYNINSVSYVLVYTICLVLFFSYMPNSIIEKYPYLFILLTVGLGCYTFHKASNVNYAKEFNINYERIKSIIMLFCLITTIIILYVNDPGGLIKKYFGSLYLLTILISVFALAYVIILISLTNEKPDKQSSFNLLESFSKFGTYGTFFFFVFLIVMVIAINTYPGGFFTDDNKTRAGAIIILIIWVLTMLGILLTSNLFPEITNNNLYVSKLETFKKSLLILFGLTLAIITIMWFIKGTEDLSSSSDIVSFIVNLILLLSILALIYKIIFVKLPTGNENKNAILHFVTSVIFYIPCFFSEMLEKIVFQKTPKDEKSYWHILLAVLSLYVLYIGVPILRYFYLLQGGKILLKDPTPTTDVQNLGNYESLNKNGDLDYNYAISFWFFLNSFPPNANSSYNRFSNLVSYAKKPTVSYNASLNALRISIKHEDLKDKTKNKLIDFDEDGNRIVYLKNKMPLQKWNNLILNFDGGTLDVFLNGELVSSNIGVTPYYTLDSLIVGEENGYVGSICNLMYFQKTLTKPNIYYLYDTLKTKTPPVIENNYF